MEQRESNSKIYDGLDVRRYEKPTWQRPNVSKKEIDKLKANLKKQTNELKSMLKSVIDSQPDKGTNLETLVTRFKEGDPKLREELQNINTAIIPQNVPSKSAGITYAEKQELSTRVYEIENQLFEAKTGFTPSAENLHILGSKLGIWDQQSGWASGFSGKKLRELVLLDDPPAFLTQFLKKLPLIGQLAGPLVDSFIPGAGTLISTAGKLLGNPTSETNMESGMVIIPTKNPTQSKEERQLPLVQEKTMRLAAETYNTIDTKMFDPNLVDIPTLATTLAPEYYKEVAKYNDLQAAAIYTSFYEIPVVPTTANGSFFFLFNAAVDYTAGTFDHIAYTGSANTYVPLTGAYTGALTTINNPFIGNTSVASARLVGASVTYKPTVITNTQFASGQIDFYHDPALIVEDPAFQSPSQYFTLNNIGYRPFYQRGPVVGEYIQVWYNPLDSVPFKSSGNGDGADVIAPIVLIVSGANLSGQQIGVITVNLVWNVIPTVSGMSALPMRLPGIGPKTPFVADWLYTRYPQLYSADLETRMKILQEVYNTDSSYTNVLKAIYASGLKRKHSNHQVSNNQTNVYQA